MFGFSDGDEDAQRLWNLIHYKMYLTNKEFKEFAPTYLIISAVVIVIVIIAVICLV
jgi:hypothetical protein